MSDLLASVEDTIRTQHLLCEGQSILIGVSGGVDSMVLLHVLHGLSPKFGWRLVVAHFNHRLRGRASDADETLVEKIATSLGLEFVSGHADARRFARRHKLSLEMAGRKLRHEFFTRTCSRLDVGTVALAHHADDQVELFFLRLLRGAGSEGLAGMDWAGPSPSDPAIQLVRPFLDLGKAELRAFAEQQDIAYREDATNTHLEHQRNRIRHELLPLLQSKYQPALAKVISRAMEIVRAESDLISELARAWMARSQGQKSQGLTHPSAALKRTCQARNLRSAPSWEGSGGWFPLQAQGAIAANTFDELPAAIQRRVLQLELAQLGVTPEFDRIERLRRSVGEIITINPSLAVWRDECGRLHSRPARTDQFSQNGIALDLASGSGHSAFDGLRVAWQIQPWRGIGPWRVSPDDPFEQFDAKKVGALVFLRHWQPGDRFQPIGLRTPVKVQDLFTNAKIPRRRRHELLLATTAQGEIFWIEGLRISERFKISSRTKSSLKWAWKRPNSAVASPMTAC